MGSGGANRDRDRLMSSLGRTGQDSQIPSEPREDGAEHVSPVKNLVVKGSNSIVALAGFYQIARLLELLVGKRSERIA
jgi:hypothetical protein